MNRPRKFGAGQPSKEGRLPPWHNPWNEAFLEFGEPDEAKTCMGVLAGVVERHRLDFPRGCPVRQAAATALLDWYDSKGTEAATREAIRAYRDAVDVAVRAKRGAA